MNRANSMDLYSSNKNFVLFTELNIEQLEERKLIACFAIKISGWDAHMILVIGALNH
jgi:hypothetical protein